VPRGKGKEKFGSGLQHQKEEERAQEERNRWPERFLQAVNPPIFDKLSLEREGDLKTRGSSENSKGSKNPNQW